MRKNPAYFAASALVILMMVGIFLISQYASIERERDLQDWQVKLRLIADTRYEAVDSWIETQYAVVRHLAENGSLQLYLTQLLRRQSEKKGKSEPAQLTYLRNLLIATADRTGFKGPDNATSQIRANIITRNDSGLALVDARGKIIVATPGMPELDAETIKTLKNVLSTGKRAIRDAYLNSADMSVMGFMFPVFDIQAFNKSNGHAEITGVIVGIKRIDAGLFPLLKSGGLSTNTDETMLVRAENDIITYLSPLADGSAPLKRRLAMNTANLAASYSIEHPGGFDIRWDYAQHEVLVTSRSFPGLPWVLVQKINTQEAMRESDSHQRFLYTSFLLAMFVIAATLIAAWRHGSSIKERAIAHKLAAKSNQLQTQTELLNSITDNITDYIYLINTKHRIMFANQSLANAAGVKQEDLLDKTISAVFGPEIGKKIKKISEPVLENGKAGSTTVSIEINGIEKVFHTTLIPLLFGKEESDCILAVLHDITELQEEQRKRANLMQQLVSTLMKAVDKHDPFCSEHSDRTVTVALAIGRAMDLQESDLEALKMAANLANIGKLMVPKEILTKVEPLSDEEQDVLKHHVQYSVEILSGLEFDGPVLETIAQRSEYMDGSGYPKGLQGDEILLTARILSVANAFVAMVCSRAYRPGISVESTLDKLLEESKTRYDRHVVAALFHVAENNADWSDWHKTTIPPTA